MDAQSRLILQPNPSPIDSFSADFPTLVEVPENVPAELSSASDASLIQLCDSLFLELDSEMPDLRAMERYQSICDELSLRRVGPGVA